MSGKRVQKQRAPPMSSAAFADTLPSVHDYQKEEDFVKTMIVLHARLMRDVNSNALALKRLGLTLRQLVVLGVSKRAMEKAGINTAQIEPRWEPPAAKNKRTVEAYRGKVHGKRITGYAAYDEPVYHFRDERHIKECYIIAELPQYRTKAIPMHGRYRVRFRLNKDFTESSRLIAGVVDRDTFNLYRNEKTWDRELCDYDLVGLCSKKGSGDKWWSTPAGPPTYAQNPRTPLGKEGDIVDVVVDNPYGKMFINNELVFMQTLKPYTLYTRLVPIVMAQEVDITLESVDELPPTKSQQLQAAGSGPALRL